MSDELSPETMKKVRCLSDIIYELNKRSGKSHEEVIQGMLDTGTNSFPPHMRPIKMRILPSIGLVASFKSMRIRTSFVNHFHRK